MEQKNKRLMIFLAGEIRNERSISKMIQAGVWDFYAADGGYRYAKRFCQTPQVVLGDFDSIEQPNIPNLLVFPQEKDETDAEIALNLGIKNGYSDIWLIAPFGGRMDHTIANLHLLDKALCSNVDLKLYDGENLVFLLKQGEHIINPMYRYVSFFPWEQQTILSLSQFKYPLDHYKMIKDKSITVSNEPLGDCPTVSVHQGTVLCICVENTQEEI